VVGMTMLVVVQRRRRAYLFFGWLWFLAALGPVIGIVQVGMQAMADRYTYVPGIGLGVMGVWWVGEMVGGLRVGRKVVAVGASVVLGSLVGLTQIQLGYWHDTLRLFEHALACTRDNFLAELYVAGNESRRAQEMASAGDVAGAAALYSESNGRFARSLAIRGDLSDTHFNFGNSLLRQKRLAEAVEQYKAVTALRPGNAQGHYMLGVAYSYMGEYGSAIGALKRAVEIDPNFAEARCALGTVYSQVGRSDLAMGEFRAALRLNPTMRLAQNGLAAAEEMQRGGGGSIERGRGEKH